MLGNAYAYSAVTDVFAIVKASPILSCQYFAAVSIRSGRWGIEMRVVVTGGAGFLGSHLTDALVNRGDEVVCVDDLSTGRRTNIVL